MAQALLGTKQLAPADEEGGHTVAEAVEAASGNLGGDAQVVEPVAGSAGGETGLVSRFGGEEPVPEHGSAGEARPPRCHRDLPQLNRAPTESQASGAACLGRPELLGRHASFDGEDASVEIARSQCDQLASSSSGVRRQAYEEAHLLDPVQPRPSVWCLVGDGDGLGHEALGGCEQPDDLVVG